MADPVKRARICLITETYYPVIGGGETQARTLTQDLVARGYPVLLVTRRSQQQFAAREQLDGADIVRLSPAGPGQLKKWAMLVTSFWWFIRARAQYDVILVSGYRVLGIAAVCASRLTGKKCILKADNNGEMSGAYFVTGIGALGLGWAAKLIAFCVGLRNRLFRKADVFIALSTDIAAELQQHGVAPMQIRNIANSYDSDRFIPVANAHAKVTLRERFGFPLEQQIVMFTGRLLRGKGLPLLVKVWEQLRLKHTGASLVIVGSGGHLMGSCEEEIKSFVNDAGLTDSVYFTGGVRNVEEYLQCADIFAFPTEDEAFGISLVEAMACGIPPVGSAVGGVKDIITDGATGLLVQASDFAALYSALDRLLCDPLLAGRLGAGARASVLARYTRQAVADQYTSLFDRLIARV